jgi:hypothetical protein
MSNLTLELSFAYRTHFSRKTRSSGVWQPSITIQHSALCEPAISYSQFIPKRSRMERTHLELSHEIAALN